MTLERISIEGAPIVQTVSDKRKNRTGSDSSAPSKSAVPKNDGTTKLQRAENKVRSMEQSLRAQGGRCVSSVSYRYLTGPDGKKYIVGAEISISAPEDVMEDLGLSVGSFPDRLATVKADRAYGGKSKAHEGSPKQADNLSAGEKRVIDDLKIADQEVRTHEAAHQRAGAPFAGMATYEYVTGPDDKQYAVAGKVPISIPTGNTPEETIAAMEKVRGSALSPASPSGKDMEVAAEAENMASRARMEIARREAQKAYSIIRPYHDGDILSMVA